MEHLKDSNRSDGGQVTGVIPESLAPREISGEVQGGKTVVVPDMHTRKLTMYKLSDAFIGTIFTVAFLNICNSYARRIWYLGRNFGR